MSVARCWVYFTDSNADQMFGRGLISAMSKFTLSFKGRLLSVHPMDHDTLLVGRDPECDIVIDSLALAPHHARLVQTEDGVRLENLNEETGVYVNGKRVEVAQLRDGDLILIGKHTLTFSDRGQESILSPRAMMPRPNERDEPSEPPVVAPGFIQVQSGALIGEILTLSRAVTRLTRIGGGEVIITRRGGGFVLTRFGDANVVYVGRQAILDDSEVPLEDGVSIEIDGTQCQFFRLAPSV